MKFCEKNFKKKIQKKIEERLPRFSRSQIGGGGGGAYTDAMVVACLYTCTGIEIWMQISTKIRGEAIHPDAYLSGLSGVCGLVGLLWFASVWFGLV